jgi:hypothetical protein
LNEDTDRHVDPIVLSPDRGSPVPVPKVETPVEVVLERKADKPLSPLHSYAPTFVPAKRGRVGSHMRGKMKDFVQKHRAEIRKILTNNPYRRPSKDVLRCERTKNGTPVISEFHRIMHSIPPYIVGIAEQRNGLPMVHTFAVKLGPMYLTGPSMELPDKLVYFEDPRDAIPVVKQIWILIDAYLSQADRPAIPHNKYTKKADDDEEEEESDKEKSVTVPLKQKVKKAWKTREAKQKKLRES